MPGPAPVHAMLAHCSRSTHPALSRGLHTHPSTGRDSQAGLARWCRANWAACHNQAASRGGTGPRPSQAGQEVAVGQRGPAASRLAPGLLLQHHRGPVLWLGAAERGALWRPGCGAGPHHGGAAERREGTCAEGGYRAAHCSAAALLVAAEHQEALTLFAAAQAGFNCAPGRQQQQDALVAALASTVWQAQLGGRASVASCSEPGPIGSLTYDQLMRVTTVCTASSQAAVEVCHRVLCGVFADEHCLGLHWKGLCGGSSVHSTEHTNSTQHTGTWHNLSLPPPLSVTAFATQATPGHTDRTVLGAGLRRTLQALIQHPQWFFNDHGGLVVPRKAATCSNQPSKATARMRPQVQAQGQAPMWHPSAASAALASCRLHWVGCGGRSKSHRAGIEKKRRSPAGVTVCVDHTDNSDHFFAGGDI
jgi:hypothetical protein